MACHTSQLSPLLLQSLAAPRQAGVSSAVPHRLQEGHDARAPGAPLLQGHGGHADGLRLPRGAAPGAELAGASGGDADEATDHVDVVAPQGHQLGHAEREGPAQAGIAGPLPLDELPQGGLPGDVLNETPVCWGHVVPHAVEEVSYEDVD